jgi:hypothetical protein
MDVLISVYKFTPDDIVITVITCVVEVGQFLPGPHGRWHHGRPSAYKSIFPSQTGLHGLYNIFCFYFLFLFFILIVRLENEVSLPTQKFH